ncbi:MAG: hypothetical protein E6R06_17190 [Mycobacterium sp.]|nr:MAG: hypothetical protein E6R06_17190 [Mycobacterium sp.]
MPVIAWWEEITVNAKPAAAVLTVTGGTPGAIIGGGPIRPAPSVLTVTGSAPTVRVSQHKRITPTPDIVSTAVGAAVAAQSARGATEDSVRIAARSAVTEAME